MDFGGGPDDWSRHGHGLRGNAPTGDQYTIWGTSQWLSCGATVANAHYQTRNARGWGMKADHTYMVLDGGFEWVDERDPTTATGGSGEPAGTHNYNAADWLMPAGQRSIHWASYRRSMPPGLIGIVVVYEARGNGIMANAGYDNISGGNITGDGFISKYVALDAVQWRHVGGSSITAALLRQYPPPL